MSTGTGDASAWMPFGSTAFATVVAGCTGYGSQAREMKVTVSFSLTVSFSRPLLAMT